MRHQRSSHNILKDLEFAALALAVPLCLLCTGMFAADPFADVDPELMLQQIREKARDHLSQLRNYTCHVEVNRWTKGAGSNGISPQDKVEFEAAFVGDRELFARLGETQFEERPISSIVPEGMISNNAFGSHDDIVLSGDAAIFKYRGHCNKDGHSAFRYDFIVPQEKSQFLVKHNAEEAIVGYKGTLWVDSETLDVVRLDWRTEHIPSSVGISSIEKVMHYGALRIGRSEFLLPNNSELTAYDSHGDFNFNIITLKGCREFTGESTVKYDRAR